MPRCPSGPRGLAGDQIPIRGVGSNPTRGDYNKIKIKFPVLSFLNLIHHTLPILINLTKTY